MNHPPGQFTYQEITGQWQAWEASLQAFEARRAEWQAWLRSSPPEMLFTGCGSTHYLALASAAVWQQRTGWRCRGVPASELWLFPDNVLAGNSDRPPRLVAISRSGETTETLRAVETFTRRTGGDWLAVGCYAESALVRRAPQALVAQQAEEESVAQTRSFTSMFLLTQALAALTAGEGASLEQLQRLPGIARRLIGETEGLIIKLAEDDRLQRFVFLGSGANYGLACEAMLKMKEMSLSSSEAFHFLEFRHGPKSVVAPGTLVIGLLSQAARQQESQVLDEMRQLGATVFALDESAADLPADFGVEYRSGLPDAARRILALPPLQLLAYYRSRHKGLNPDRPTHLEAVVRLSA